MKVAVAHVAAGADVHVVLRCAGGGLLVLVDQSDPDESKVVVIQLEKQRCCVRDFVSGSNLNPLTDAPHYLEVELEQFVDGL